MLVHFVLPAGGSSRSTLRRAYAFRAPAELVVLTDAGPVRLARRWGLSSRLFSGRVFCPLNVAFAWRAQGQSADFTDAPAFAKSI